ncbi:MAG TPA: LssY C-terminal domain-containing protein [Candidatus Woesebacteria bacterium]|nr:LssY C-terminal domain-containing protein [Candidatus Woesebacteria bacterium]
MVKIIKSVTKSIGRGVKNDPEVSKIIQRYPKLFRFLKKRLTPTEKYGLHFTIGFLITLFFIYIFFGILQDYIGNENIIQFDLRVLNLFSALRHPKLNQQMLFITYLAKGEIIIIGTIITSLILFLFKKRRFIKTLLISVLGGEVLVWLIKHLISRPRPPLTDSLVIEPSYSFPSGHTFVALAFYGLLAYFVIQSERRKFLKVIIFLISLSLISLVGISRIYLGAHWPSDVLASLAVGSAWLVIMATSLKIKKKFTPPKPDSIQFHPVVARSLSVLLILTWIAFIYSYYYTHPLAKSPQNQPPPITTVTPDQIKHQLFQQLPKVSESINSYPAEPINIIIVGSESLINRAFTDIGWYLLDRPGIKVYAKLVNSVIFNQPYPNAPGLPVFWDTKPNLIGFGRPDTPGSVSSRHHIHFWKTNFVTPDNQPVWVGTAHFDQNIKKKFKIVMPFHQTELLVDNEREDIKNQLTHNGFVKSFEKINLTGLTYGTKKSGNNFLTDGQAYILYLQLPK